MTQATPPDRLGHLRILLPVSAVLLLGTALGGLVLGGPVAALGAAAGAAIVVASYLFTTLLVAYADRIDPRLVLPVGMAAYVTKFTALMLLMLVLLNADWPGTLALAVGMVVGVFGWTGTHIWWVTHGGSPYRRAVPPVVSSVDP